MDPNTLDKPFHLLDEHERPIPGEEPHAELTDANHRAQALGCRVIVVKIVPPNPPVAMSHTGPGGWGGPKAKSPYPSHQRHYGIRPQRKHVQ